MPSKGKNTGRISEVSLANLRPGNPGNKGGTGRPKNEIRADCLKAWDENFPKLLEMLDSENEQVRLKAFDTIGKYGGLQQVDMTSGDKAFKSAVIQTTVEDSDV